MNLRQQQQQAFDRSGEPLIVGNVSHCPLPPETLAALGPDSPYVVQVYGSGLTGEVYRLRIAGKEYNLKKRRAVAGVANLNGQLSFLNEVQRRQALQQLKDDPVTAPRFTHIVPTLYADYRLGILLSPWIDGEPIHQLTPPLIAQLFTTLEACEEQGLMEWDLCSGNLLVDRQEQLWLFDFGYMYPFDPLREFNSNGLADPLFHFVERFETRFFFSWLMTRIPDAEQQLAQYREMKRLAVESYRRKLVWLRARRADPLVLAHFQQLTARWESALADPAALSRLFAVEAFRSHVLDIEDDLHGQSCTLLTLQRIDWVINQLEQHYRFIADEGGLFYDNAGKSQQALLGDYAQKRQQAQQPPQCRRGKGLTAFAPLFLLRLIHQAVGGGHQRVETGMAGGIIFDAAPGERQLPGIGRLLVETRHVVAERLHRRRGIVAAGIGEQNDKFVPTLPREDIGLAEGRFHQVGDGDQRAIALFMPPGIIDVLEAIEVDKRQAHRLMAALGRQQGILCQGEEPPAIKQSRQLIRGCRIQHLELILHDRRQIA